MSYKQSDKFDSVVSPENLANQLQDIADQIVKDCLDVDWNEDFLSFMIVRAIRLVLGELPFSRADYHFNNSEFDIEAYKLTGLAEQTHGDIAIVVTRSYYAGAPPISGVGFYEAKASSIHGYDYPAFSIQQLRRLVTNTPKLSYLLYDKKLQIADAQEWPTFPKENFPDGNQFHVRTIDANLLKQYKSLSNAAYFMGQPFGYHFVHKILSGRDLDYSRPPLETIRRWLETTRSTSSVIVSIVINDSEKKLTHPQLGLPGFEKLPDIDKRDLLPGEKMHFLKPKN